MKSTLSFIAGMLVGIILFVVAIGGAVFGLATATTVGDLQSTIGVDIIKEDSDIFDKSIWEMVELIIEDVQNIDKLTVQTLIDKYGLPIPSEISGVDISAVFKYPIFEITNHVDEIVNSVTLTEIGGLIGVDFSTYTIPVIQDNLNNNIQTAMNNILGMLNESDSLTLRAIENSFGITLGENEMLDMVKDTPFPQIAGVLTSLMLGELITADTDTFVQTGINTVYVTPANDAARFVEIPKAELATHAAGLGVKSYYAGLDANKNLIKNELRYIRKTTTDTSGAETTSYVVDNSSHASGYDANADENVYYRCIEYTPYISGTYSDYFIPSYANAFKHNGTAYSPYMKGFLSLGSIFTNTDMSQSLITTEMLSTIDIGTDYYFSGKDETQSTVAKPTVQYGYDATALTDSNTHLSTDYTGYIIVHEGTSEPVLQTVAYLTLDEIQHDDSWISTIKLGDVIQINASSPLIMRSLADYTLGNISTAVDSLTLGEIIEIVPDTYTVDTNGTYVYIAQGNYYAIYNAANPAHSGATRYTKTSDSESPDLLQRFAGSSLTGFSSDFGSLVLSDVLDINPNIYTNVSESFISANPTNTYYYYSDGLYKEASPEYISAHPTDQFYMLSIEGSSNIILKKLAFVGIDNMASKMEEVINETYLADLIDVSYNTIVGAYTDGTTEKYIVAPDETYSIQSGDTISRYTFVYDTNGKYTKRPTTYEPALTAQLIPADAPSISFSYKQIYSTTEPVNPLDRYTWLAEGGAAVAEKELTQNVFYLNASGEYERNPALTTYLATQGRFEKLYYRETTDAAGEGVYSEDVYKSNNLFVEILGNYVPYSPSNPAHAGQPLYYLYTDGYYPASVTQLNDDSVTKFYFDYTENAYVTTSNADCGATVYVKIAPTPDDNGGTVQYNGTDVFYYVLVDNTLLGSETLYSKVYCETIYRKSAAGEYVHFDGAYVAYSSENAAHNGLTRYDAVTGYLATLNQTALLTTDESRIRYLSEDKVSVISEKSVPVLQAFARNKATISTLNDCISTLKVSDLMDLEPGSMFDDEKIRNATLSTLSSVLTDTIGSMTIGKLLEWGNINNIEPAVKAILAHATLRDFFRSIKYDNGALVIDIALLLGA